MKGSIGFVMGLCVLMLCGLTSCENEENSQTKEELLVGKWQSTKVEYQEYENEKIVYESTRKCIDCYDAFDFKDNGTGNYIVYEIGYSYLEEISSWSIMGEKLIIKLLYDDDDKAVSFDIVEITETSMVLKSLWEETEYGVKYKEVETLYFKRI